MGNLNSIVIKDLKLLHFLVINAQCYLNERKELSQMDKDVAKFAGDLIVEIRSKRV